MVSTDGRRQKSYLIATIKKILKQAKVPPRWYSINKPIDNRVCIVLENDGIHVFIPERGERTGEQIYNNWYFAIVDIADCFELQYTQSIKRIAAVTLIKEVRCSSFAAMDDHIHSVFKSHETPPISAYIKNTTKNISGGNRTRAIMTALITCCIEPTYLKEKKD